MKRIIVVLAVDIVLSSLSYSLKGFSQEGIILLLLINLIALTLIIAFTFEPSKRKLDDEKRDIIRQRNDIDIKVCHICGTNNKNLSKFCKKCGSILRNIICPVCGVSNKFDQKYCTSCDSILQNRKRH